MRIVHTATFLIFIILMISFLTVDYMHFVEQSPVSVSGFDSVSEWADDMISGEATRRTRRSRRRQRLERAVPKPVIVREPPVTPIEPDVVPVVSDDVPVDVPVVPDVEPIVPEDVPVGIPVVPDVVPVVSDEVPLDIPGELVVSDDISDGLGDPFGEPGVVDDFVFVPYDPFDELDIPVEEPIEPIPIEPFEPLPIVESVPIFEPEPIVEPLPVESEDILRPVPEEDIVGRPRLRSGTSGSGRPYNIKEYGNLGY